MQDFETISSLVFFLIDKTTFLQWMSTSRILAISCNVRRSTTTDPGVGEVNLYTRFSRVVWGGVRGWRWLVTQRSHVGSAGWVTVSLRVHYRLHLHATLPGREGIIMYRDGSLGYHSITLYMQNLLIALSLINLELVEITIVRRSMEYENMGRGRGSGRKLKKNLGG